MGEILNQQEEEIEYEKYRRGDPSKYKPWKPIFYEDRLDAYISHPLPPSKKERQEDD